jgi:hypothetical protein
VSYNVQRSMHSLTDRRQAVLLHDCFDADNTVLPSGLQAQDQQGRTCASWQDGAGDEQR